jgi:hypothetical protein
MDGWQARIETMGSHVPSILLEVIQWGFDQANADIERERQEAADQELEACVAWLDGFDREGWAAEQLRAARRPKPKSEKQQALEAFDRIEYAPSEAEDFAIILRALQSIPDEQ